MLHHGPGCLSMVHKQLIWPEHETHCCNSIQIEVSAQTSNQLAQHLPQIVNTLLQEQNGMCQRKQPW